MLARTLISRGSKVGLLDADVYGPSIPTLFNIHRAGVRATENNEFYPNEVDGLKLMSFGFLMGDESSSYSWTNGCAIYATTFAWSFMGRT